jgi:hypothetical protein
LIGVASITTPDVVEGGGKLMRIFLALLLMVTPALAQIPAGPGQLPGTLPPAPPIAPPPALTAPPPVPSAVTPIRTPSYGVPGGEIRRTPTYGTTSIYRVQPKPRHHKGQKKKKRPRTSEIVLIRTV